MRSDESCRHGADIAGRPGRLNENGLVAVEAPDRSALRTRNRRAGHRQTRVGGSGRRRRRGTVMAPDARGDGVGRAAGPALAVTVVEEPASRGALRWTRALPTFAWAMLAIPRRRRRSGRAGRSCPGSGQDPTPLAVTLILVGGADAARGRHGAPQGTVHPILAALFLAVRPETGGHALSDGSARSGGGVVRRAPTGGDACIAPWLPRRRAAELRRRRNPANGRRASAATPLP